MLDIEFSGHGGYDAAREAVLLPIQFDGADIRYYVSRDALLRKFGAAADADPGKVFDENRLQIEMIATLYLRQGKGDGTVLTADDF